MRCAFRSIRPDARVVISPARPALLSAAVAIVLVAGQLRAQTSGSPPSSTPFVAGTPLGIVSPGAARLEPLSPNVTVFGAIHNAESCAYDAERGLIVVANRAASQRLLPNDAFVSLIRHDGSVHTARWIGVQPPSARRALLPALTLNDPFGSEIAGGVLYLADSDGNTSADDPRVAVIRKFDLRSGAPVGDMRVPQAQWLNDLAVAKDGTIYATRTGDFGASGNPATWQVLRVAVDGAVQVLAEGAPLFMPNGIALDGQGNVVVANSGDSAIVTFSPAGHVLRTEHAAQAGSDGLVILADGTKYVSSVFQGGVSRIRPGRPAELIARNIPSPASMCHDVAANQLVIPMNDQNGLAFVRLR